MNTSREAKKYSRAQQVMFRNEVKECMRELRRKHPCNITIEHSAEGLMIWPGCGTEGEPIVRMNHKAKFYDPRIVEKYLKKEGYRHLRRGGAIHRFVFYLK